MDLWHKQHRNMRSDSALELWVQANALHNPALHIMSYVLEAHANPAIERLCEEVLWESRFDKAEEMVSELCFVLCGVPLSVDEFFCGKRVFGHKCSSAEQESASLLLPALGLNE